MRRTPIPFVKRLFGNAIRARLSDDKMSKPLVASLYITTKCNFRCTYCDDGTGTLYPDVPETHRMETEQAKQVISIMAKVTPGFNVTGGEPTMRKDIVELYEHIHAQGFYPITLNTNASLLERYKKVMHYIDWLVVSVDAVNPERFDELIDVGKGGQAVKVMANLEMSREYKKEHKLPFETMINSVITPETIDDAWEVFEYCIANRYMWSPMGHVNGKYPNAGLIDNPRWVELMNEVIRAKKQGAWVYGNLRSLRIMRDFTRYECYPTTRPIVYPNGDLLYPCGPFQTRAANLLEVGDYQKALTIGINKHGPVPVCDNRCHVGCYSEASTLIEQPSLMVMEAARWLSPYKYVTINKPARHAPMVPPKMNDFRDLLALPPEEIREMRAQGRLENDFTSRIRIREIAEPLAAR